MEMLAPILPAIFGVGGLLWWWLHAQARADAWRGAVTRVGLTDIEQKTTLGFLTAIEGHADRLRVRIESRQRGNGKRKHGTRITVSGEGDIPYGFDLRAEGFYSQMDRTFGGKEIEIGDLGFDQEIYARGPEDVLRAVCDERTRSLVRAVIGMEGRVLEGGVRVDVKELLPSVETLSGVLGTALDLAKRLVQPEDVAARMADLVRSDPVEEVRVRCLAHLARAHANHPAAQAVFREALAMRVDELRLRAAIALGGEGREVLRELALPEQGQEGVAVRAIAALGKDLGLERAVAILDSASRRELRDVTRAAIAALALVPEGDVLPHLAPYAAGDDLDLALAAVRALQVRADARAEPTLIPLLASQSGALRVAAAEALGTTGSAQAVAPLRAAVDAHLLDLDLRSAARQAIAAIQSRLPGASPGQLSIATGEDGQLSMADDRGGRVSQSADPQEDDS